MATSGPRPKPAAETPISVELVRALLRSQHPDLADRAVTHIRDGWDNALYRVGDDLVARLPRRAAAVPLLVTERDTLPALAGRLPLAVPAAVRVGAPGCGYPWPWVIGRWFPGTDLLDAVLDDPVGEAERLASFVAALHSVPPVASLPVNPVRGVPLADRAEVTETWLTVIADHVDVERAFAVWRDALAAPRWAGAPVWLHGDLHRGNVVVDGGRVTGVIDFGDTCHGDPASDLSAAWILPSIDDARRRFASLLEYDEATWRRARGWALSLGGAYAANGADDPRYFVMGIETIESALSLALP